MADDRIAKVGVGIDQDMKVTVISSENVTTVTRIIRVISVIRLVIITGVTRETIVLGVTNLWLNTQAQMKMLSTSKNQIYRHNKGCLSCHIGLLALKTVSLCLCI